MSKIYTGTPLNKAALFVDSAFYGGTGASPAALFEGENLIVNPDFRTPINTRGTLTSTTYEVSHTDGVNEYDKSPMDNWRIVGGGFYKLEDAYSGGVRVWCPNTSRPKTRLCAMVVNRIVLCGKTKVISMCVNGTTQWVKWAVPNLTAYKSWMNGQLLGTWAVNSAVMVEIIARGGNLSFEICLRNYDSVGIALQWFKVELSDEFTSFSPPNRATEMLKIQRYYSNVIWPHSGQTNNIASMLYGMAHMTNKIYVIIPIVMRTAPAIRIANPGGIIIWGYLNATTTSSRLVTGVAPHMAGGSAVYIEITSGTNNLSVGLPYLICSDSASSRIILDATL
jgi:hypothetical protein